jgi:hypothetical protein
VIRDAVGTLTANALAIFIFFLLGLICYVSIVAGGYDIGVVVSFTL